MKSDHHQQRLRLSPQPTSAGRARRFVGTALDRSGASKVSDVGVLLTSELVTNAVLYAQGPIEVSVQADSGVVRISVCDESRARPVPRHPRPQDTSGRGLRLVETLAQRWGVEHDDDNGKRVWFELAY